MNVHFELTSAHAIKDFELLSKSYPFKIEKRDEHTVVGGFSGDNITFTEDFTVRYTLDNAKADSLQVITHRDPNSSTPSPDEMAPVRSTNEPGFFEAEALLAMGAHASAADTPAAYRIGRHDIDRRRACEAERSEAVGSRGRRRGRPSSRRRGLGRGRGRVAIFPERRALVASLTFLRARERFLFLLLVLLLIKLSEPSACAR